MMPSRLFSAYVTQADHESPPHDRGPDKRQRQYLEGRRCANQALLKAGFKGADCIIEKGLNGEPIWPLGWVGSITHTQGYTAAAVARSIHLRGMGIDSEPIMSLDSAQKTQHRILTQNEADRASTSIPFSNPIFVTLVFSAKESIYKCLRPHVSDFFGFQGAEIFAIDQSLGQFQFRLTKKIGHEFVAGWVGLGRFYFNKQLVHTSVELNL